jgi:hypothetical protein
MLAYHVTSFNHMLNKDLENTYDREGHVVLNSR